MKNELPQTCTTGQAAEMLKLSPKSVVRLIRVGVIPASLIGGKYVILQSEIMKFFNLRIVLPKGR